MASAGRERGIEIGNPQADVVNTRTPTRQELRDRTIGCDGCEELDLHVAELYGDDVRAVGGTQRPGGQTEHVAVESLGVIEVRDRDADVGNRRVGQRQGSSDGRTSVNQHVEGRGRDACNLHSGRSRWQGRSRR